MGAFADQWIKKNRETTTRETAGSFSENWIKNHSVNQGELSQFGIEVDQEVLQRAKENYAKTFKNDYDLDYDMERRAKGLMPVSYDKKYGDSALDRYLYENNLPDSSKFEEIYNKAVDEINKERQKKLEETAPERQYQQVFNAIGQDLTPYLDEEGNLSENKVLDYLYGSVFNSDEYADLKKKWKEKGTGTVKSTQSYEESLSEALESEGAYGIDKLMGDLNEAWSKVKQQEQQKELAAGLGVTPGLDIEAYLPDAKSTRRYSPDAVREEAEKALNASASLNKDDLTERAAQLREEILLRAQNGGDIEAPQAELDAIESALTAEETAEKEQREAEKAQREAQDEAFKAAVDVNLLQHTTSALGAAPMLIHSDELQAQVDAFRGEQNAKGLSPLEIDNIIRRNGLKEYINTDVVRNYAMSVISESEGISLQDAALRYDRLPQSEKDMYKADMQFDNRVEETGFEEAGRALVSVPVRAALDLVNSAYNFAEMANPAGQLMDATFSELGAENPADIIRDKLNEWSYKIGQYGTSENHQFLNAASGIATELVKMYALNAAGGFAASSLGKGSAAAAATTAQQKGMGLLANYARKVFSGQSLPFIASAMGSGYNQALMDGASRGEAAFYGMLTGAMEGALETIGADEMFNKTFTKAFAQRGVEGGKKLLSQGGMQFVNLVASALGNGIEEGASYLLGGIAELVIYNPEWEFNSSEFWENIGMGALVGTFGSIATMSETSRAYKLLQEAISTGDVRLAEQAKMAYDVENMPQAKRDSLGEGQLLPVEEYQKVTRDKYKAIQDKDNAKAQYDAQVAAADERVAAAQKSVDDLKTRLSAIVPDGKENIDQIAQLSKEIAAANSTLEKTIQSADAAKQTARKEYESRSSTLQRQVVEAERALDANSVAYDTESKAAEDAYVEGYLEAVDPDLVEFVEASAVAKDNSLRPYELKPVSNRAADDIKALTGVDATGFATMIEQKQAKHVVKDHGKNGLSDKSMADTKDIGRIQFVLDNYDSVVATGRGAKGYKERIPGTDMNRSAQTVRFEKKVNGTYYVVEAIPDTARKTAYIVTAFKSKKGTDQFADAKAPARNVQDATNLVPDQSIPQVPNAMQAGEGGFFLSQPEYGESKVRENTLNAVFEAADLALMDEVNDLSEYEIIRERDSLQIARQQIDEFGIDGMESRLYNKHRNWSSSDVDAAMALIQTFVAEGDHARASDLALELRERATVGGQLIQALAKYSRTAAGSVINVENVIEKMNKEFAKSLKKAGKEGIEIDEELRQKLIAAKDPAEIDAVIDEIAVSIAPQLPSTFAEQINAWRYFAMLGNIKTHVRNVAGNGFMYLLRQAKNAVAAGAERMIIKDRSQRTKAIVNRFSEQGKALLDYAKSTLPEVEGRLSGNKESIKTGDKLRDRVAESRTIFKLKPAEWLRKANEAALNFEDLDLFGKPAYVEAYASVMQARGLTPDTVTAEQRQEIADIAIEEAHRATFREANSLAAALNNLEQTNAATRLLFGGLLPFKKTPLNVLKRGVEYSPVGIMQGTKQLVADVKKGKVTAAQAIDKMSSGLVGTSLMALGAWAISAGWLRAGGEDDENYEYYMQDLGYQPYSVQVGDTTFTVDWITPASIPFFIGAELASALKGTSTFDFDAVMRAFGQTADPLVQLSMLQGINDAISNLKDDEIGGAIGAVAGGAVESLVGQMVPSLFGQIARTIDPVRRTTTGDPNAIFGQDIDRSLRKIAAKIPGLSMTLEPYVDKRGELQDDDPWPLRLIENTILPGYINSIDMTNVDAEITRLYMQTERKDIFPTRPQRTLTVGGRRYTMTAKEFTEYQEAVGKAVYAALDSVVSNPAYEALTDEMKAQSLKDAIDDAEQMVREEYKAKFFTEPQK